MKVFIVHYPITRLFCGKLTWCSPKPCWDGQWREWMSEFVPQFTAFYPVLKWGSMNMSVSSFVLLVERVKICGGYPCRSWGSLTTFMNCTRRQQITDREKVSPSRIETTGYLLLFLFPCRKGTGLQNYDIWAHWSPELGVRGHHCGSWSGCHMTISVGSGCPWRLPSE